MLNEALVTQLRIKEEVQKEEVKINNRLIKNLKLVENEFACALENATSEEDKEQILIYSPPPHLKHTSYPYLSP